MFIVKAYQNFRKGMPQISNGETNTQENRQRELKSDFGKISTTTLEVVQPHNAALVEL